MPAGAKAGERRGGRTKGTQNKTTADVKVVAAHYTVDALHPLVRLMRRTYMRLVTRPREPVVPLLMQCLRRGRMIHVTQTRFKRIVPGRSASVDVSRSRASWSALAGKDSPRRRVT